MKFNSKGKLEVKYSFLKRLSRNFEILTPRCDSKMSKTKNEPKNDSKRSKLVLASELGLKCQNL